MKALTISEPWATKILRGEKRVENRNWQTTYRGPLAIHAGRGTQYLTRKQPRPDRPAGQYSDLRTAVWAMSQRVPTPTAQDAKNSTLPPSQRDRDSIPGYLLRSGSVAGGALNPTWVEWLMGWPIEWTDLEPLATDKFQQWQHSHGDCSHDA